MLTIGVVGPHFPDSFADNIACGFEDLGHRAILLNTGRHALFTRSKAAGVAREMLVRSASVARRLQRPLLQAAREQHVDAFVVVDSNVTPESADALGDIARPLCFWYPDAVSNIGRQSMFQASYDAVFSKEPRLVGPARDIAGFPAHYLPQACNPRWHRVPTNEVSHDPHLVVMGNYYPYRIRMLERLHRAAVPMRLYGNPFPRWTPSPTLAPLHTGSYVTREAKARVFRGAAAVLNVLHPAEMDGMNTRLYEATACGGCVISEDRGHLGTQYQVGTEVLAFTSFDELVDQARWCLDHPDEARQVGDRAAVRAHAEHTFAHRVVDLLHIVALQHRGSDEA
jgi:spore maturation protein CgeB